MNTPHAIGAAGPTRRIGLFCLALMAPLAAPAVPATQSPAADEPPVELTPFTVNESQDTGWRAQNTLAGSRLNSSLKETPGVLDVLTNEFLEDVGATTLSEALAYSANFEDTSAGDDGTNTSYPGANQGLNFSIRGQQARLTRNFLATDFRPEFYTTERIDVSSGPNAILFGIGSAGGVANVSTKRAKLYGSATTFDFRIDNYGSRRATLDTNHVLLPRKLALRVNAIANRGKGYLEFSNNNLNGVQLALKARPFEPTEINLEYEYDHSTGLVADPRTAYERITTWIAAGSPSITVPANWDSLTASARSTQAASYAAAGVALLGAADQPVYVGGAQPYMINIKNSLISTGTNRLLADDALIPYTVNVSGPGGRKEINRRLVGLSIDQRIAHGLFGNLSLAKESGDAMTYQSFRGVGGGATSLSADPNATLNNASAIANLSGRAFATNAAGQIINPHAGDWYLDGHWRRRQQTSSRKIAQATLAWEFDAGKWFGAHKLVANAAYSEYGTIAPNYDEVWLNAPFNKNPAAGANDVIRRSYLSNPRDASKITNLPWMDTQNLTWQHPTLGQLTSGWVQQSITRQDYRDRSGLIATQSAFFQRRLVVTAGYRRDQQVSYQYLTHNIKPPGYENSNGFDVIDANSTVDRTIFSGNTKTLGAVLRVTRWLSLYGNKSNAISPITGWKYGPDGLRGPNQEGRGVDYGAKFDLLDGKIALDVGYYDTATVGAANHYGMANKVVGTPGWAWDSIFETLNAPDGAPQVLNINDAAAVSAVEAKYPAIRPVWKSDADVGDVASTGYEARLIANPLKGLRLRGTFSTTEKSRENQMVFTQKAFAQLKSYIADLKTQYPNANIGGLTHVSGKTTQTIDQNIQAIDESIDEAISAASSGYESSKYRASFNGTYDLPGPFKGWTTGLGMRYASGRVVANYQVIDPANPNLILDTIPVYGASRTDWSGMLRYVTRSQFFGRKTKLSFQLNVENLTDKKGVEIRRYGTYQVAPGAALPPLGSPSIIWVRAPRSWSLTARVDF